MTKEQVYDLIEAHYREYHNYFVKRFTRYVRSKHRAEDIVQEAFFRALNYWERAPEDPKDLPRWFNTIMNNCSKDNQKQERMQGMSNINEEEIAIPNQQIPKIIFNQVISRIKKKPENVRNVLDMYFVNGYRASEISQQVNESVAWVKRAIYDFRQEVKQEFHWGI